MCVFVKVVLDGAGFVQPEYNLESQQSPLSSAGMQESRSLTHQRLRPSSISLPPGKKNKKKDGVEIGQQCQKAFKFGKICGCMKGVKFVDACGVHVFFFACFLEKKAPNTGKPVKVMCLYYN